MNINCNNFNDLLIELAYDELDDKTSSKMQSHANNCSKCNSALNSIVNTRKLTSQLPLPQLNSQIDASIINLAKETANKLTFFEKLGFEKLGSVVMHPAFATTFATILIISTFAYLYLNNSVSSTNKEQEGAPFKGPAIAINSSRSIKSGAIKKSPFPATSPISKLIQNNNEKLDINKNKYNKKEKTPIVVASASRARKKARHSNHLIETNNSAKKNIGRIFDNDPMGSIAATTKAAQPKTKTKKLGSAQSSKESPASSPKSFQEQTMPEDDSIETEAIDHSQNNNNYQAGIEAYNRGDCKNASKSLQKVINHPNESPTITASSLYHLAGCEKRARKCRKALFYYEKLISDYPKYYKTSTAKWEAATCHKHLGHNSRAKRLLQELTLDSTWTIKAKEELQNFH